MRTIPLFKPSITDQDIKAVSETLSSGWLSTGPKVKLFEEKLSNFLGGTKVIAVSSCTAALDVVFDVLDIKKGDEVITPSFTFASVGNLLTKRKACIKLVDIDPMTLNLDLDEVAKALSPQTKAIVPMDYGGNPVDIRKLKKLCGAIPIIHDAATSLGAEVNGEKVGSIADFTCFSFYPTKMITTIEGGAISFLDRSLESTIRQHSYLGMSKSASDRDKSSGQGAWYFDITTPSLKYNMTDVQASVGLTQLDRLPEFIKKRQILAKLYFEGIKNLKSFRLPYPTFVNEHVWNFMPILYTGKTGRNRIMDILKDQGIATTVNYIPLHERSVYGLKDLPTLKNTRRIFDQEITFPMYPELNLEDMNYIISVLKKIDQKVFK